MRSLVWFRGKDLRVADHGPLAEAAASGEVLPLFVLDPYFFEPARARELPHRMQVLRDSLLALDANLARLGSRLQVVPGRSVEVVARLAALWKVDQVLAHRWVEPFAQERDRRVAAADTSLRMAADTARKVAMQLSLWLVASLLLGALAACLTALEGAALRDGRRWNDLRP